MGLLFSLLLVTVAALVVWRTMARPFTGLLVLVAVNPFEALLRLPAELTVGRVVAGLMVLAWLFYLARDKAARARLSHRKLRIGIAIFPLVCFFGWLLSPYRGIEPRSLPYTLNVALLAFMSAMIENLIDSRRKLSVLLLVIVLSSVVAASLPVAYSFGVDLYTPLGVDPMGTIRSERAQGLTGNPNGLALLVSTGVFALVILSGIRRQLRSMVGYALLGTVLVGALILSGSRTHLVACTLFILIYLALGLYRGAKTHFVVSVVGALLFAWAGMFFYSRAPEKVQGRLIVVGSGVGGSTEKREEFVKYQRAHALKMLMKYPVFGIGLTNTKVRYGMYAHDTASALLGEVGVVGTLSLIALIVSCGRRLYQGLMGVGSKLDEELRLYSSGFGSGLLVMLIAGVGGGYIMFYQRWFWITVGVSAVIARWAEERRYACHGPRYLAEFSEQGGMQRWAPRRRAR